MGCLRTLLRRTALPRLEWQMLWQYVLGVPRAWLVAHDDDPLPPEAIERYHQLEQRRLRGEPMAYILGEREFMGYMFRVTPDVLIPRPETELLVETALQALQGCRAPRVLDLGTGSGAIAVSLALARPDADVIATDVSTSALDVAASNAKQLGAGVRFFSGAWYDALPTDMDFDLIVSNPPYISVRDQHLQQGDVRFEPASALTDGADGLQAIHAIVSGSVTRLRAKGSVFVEHGWDQASAVRTMLQHAGYVRVASWPDLAGIDRVTGGYLSLSFLEKA